MSLESVLESYPKSIKLKSGITCALRPLLATDEKGLGQFFCSLPPQDMLFLKQRITDPEVIKCWCENIDYGRNLAMLALVDKKIVAVCILHQHLGGWKRHIGHVNVHTAVEFRGKGLGRMMVNEMIDIARQSGLDRLEAEFFDKQEGAIKMFGLLGFSNLVRLDDYVRDMQAVSHDYILMGIKLITEEEYAGMG